MQVGMRALTDGEMEALLEREPLWLLADGELTRVWVFENFVEAIAFVSRVAEIAEKAQHHPDIDIRYNKVRLGLVTHDAGGVTKRDADMAGKLSREFPS